MKKFYILFFIVLNLNYTQAQSYFPLLDSISNTWHFTGNVIPLRQEGVALMNCDYNMLFGFEANQLFTTGDTVINGFIYKSITQSAFNWPGFDCVYGYIREDSASQKIYFMDNIFSPEELIYDFSMVPGNIINLNFFQTFGYYVSGNFTLDSISVAQTNVGPRRLFCLSNHSISFSPTLQWIEGVGHPGHLVYTKSANFMGGIFAFSCPDPIDRNFYQVLTCFEHGAQKVYFDSCAHAMAINNSCFFYADSCNFWNICGSIEEHNAINNAIIAPNPFGTETNLVIDANRNEKTEVNIFSLESKLIKSQKFDDLKPGKNTKQLDLHSLKPGLYFIEIRSGDYSQYLKMVKTGNNF